MSSLVAPMLTKATAEEATVISKLMEMLFSDQKELLTCVCTQMLNESLDSPEQTHCTVMGFYHRMNCALPLMKWAVSQELQTKGIETSLFRGTTPAMRLLPAFFHLVGQDFLELCLASFVRFFSHATVTSMSFADAAQQQLQLQQQGSASAESSKAMSSEATHSDPNEAESSHGKYSSIAEARLCMPCQLRGDEMSGSEFCECVEALMEHIFSLLPWCPIDVRRLLKFATVETGKMFPEQRSKVVGLFLFLRFIAPALTSPEKYGLIAAEEINENGRKTLLLASCIVQWLVNGALTAMATSQLPASATEQLKHKIIGGLRNFETKLIDVPDDDTKLPRFSALPPMSYNAVADILGVIVSYQGGITRQLEKEFSDIHATMFKRIMSLVQQKVLKKHAGKLSPAMQYRGEFFSLDSACSTSKTCATYTPSEGDLSLDVLAIEHLTAATNAIHQLRYERSVLEARLREQIRQEYAELLEEARAEIAKQKEQLQDRVLDLEVEVRSLKAENKALKRENKKLQSAGYVNVGDEIIQTRRRVHSNADKLSRAAVTRSLMPEAPLSLTLTVDSDDPGAKTSTSSLNPHSASSSSSSSAVANGIATPRRLARETSTGKIRKHKHSADLTQEAAPLPPSAIDIPPPPLDS